jgi:hypothetical protein
VRSWKRDRLATRGTYLFDSRIVHRQLGDFLSLAQVGLAQRSALCGV